MTLHWQNSSTFIWKNTAHFVWYDGVALQYGKKGEDIIQAIMAKLSQVRTANQYQTGAGAYVGRVVKKLDKTDLPAIIVWPRKESVRPEYGGVLHTLPLDVEALALHGEENPSVVGERLYGDIVEAMIGTIWAMPFTSGSHEIRAGDTVEGAESGADGLVIGLTSTGGSWAAGDGSGVLSLRRVDGTFEAENLNVGAETNVASVDGGITGYGPLETTTDSLAEVLLLRQGGMELPYAVFGAPEITGVITSWEIQYRTETGNPYET